MFLYNFTAYFLVMAIADNALFYIKSFDDLQVLEISVDKDELIFSFEESALNRPILRTYIKEKGITENIMFKSAFLRIFRAMMQKKDYFCESSIHAVRRGLRKKINDKSFFQSLFLVFISLRPAAFVFIN
jgi:hypothetical protein